MLGFKTVNLSVDLLKIDEVTYQRLHNNPKSQQLIKSIGCNLNRHAFGVLTVTKRADGWYVVDGAHRLLGAKLAGEKFVPCIVAEGLRISEEAGTYLTINGNRKYQTSAEMFKAKVVAGDPEALDINSIAERFGFQILKNGTRDHIKSTNCLISLYRNFGRANLTREFYLLRHAFDGDPLTLTKEFLIGLMLFIDKAGDKFTDSEFIKKLNKAIPAEIDKEGRTLAITRDKFAYAKAILKAYNYHRINPIPESIFYIDKK